MSAASPWIVETTAESFESDVLVRSRTVPVVVDFWAPWCQPCRMLGPLLERIADEFQGRFILVKANTDEMPEMSAAFGVESIPAVFAVRDGSLIDQFVGVLPDCGSASRRAAASWFAVAGSSTSLVAWTELGTTGCESGCRGRDVARWPGEVVWLFA